jgi:hypothetical protein
LLLVAFVEVKPIAERHAFAGGDFQVAGGRVGELFEVMSAKGVRGEQAVIAHVPPGRMARVLRMVEDRNADDLAFHRAVIIAPIGALAPRFAVALTGAGDDMAFAGALLQPHRLAQADGHRAFFGVVERHVAVAGAQRNIEIKYLLARIGGGINSHGALIRADHRPFGADPFIARSDEAGAAGFEAEKTVVDDFAEALLFRPKIQPVDRAMGKPEGAVVRMVLFLGGICLHRPITGQGQFAGADERIKVRAGDIRVKVFREQPAIHLDPEPVRQLNDEDARWPISQRIRPGQERLARTRQQSRDNA